MSQITIGGITLDFKDSSFTGDQWEQVASWVLNGGAQSIAENAQIASEKAAQAAASAASVEDTANLSESYAVGGTGTRNGEDTDNAKYYKEQAALSAQEAQSASEALQECAPYSSTKNYVVGNMATSGGSTYRCIKPCAGISPPNNAYWLIIAKKGADGAGTGDMTKETYDPNGKDQDIFAYADASSGAVQTNLTKHASNSNVHVTATEKATWDAKVNADDVPTKLSDLTGDSTHRVVTDAEKTAWNQKAEKSESKTATLTAAGWSDGVQTLTVSGITAAVNGSLRIAQSATDEQFAAWGAAQPRVTAQAAGSLTVKAVGTAPTIDIPVEVVIV